KLRTEPGRLYKWCKSRRGPLNAIVAHRQKRPIPPHVQRSLGNGLAGKSRPGILKVIGHLERGEALIANGKRLMTIGLAAFPTSQPIRSRQRSLASQRTAELRARDRLNK